jgi:hypothetical protein
MCVEGWRTHAVCCGHVEGRCSRPFVRYGGVPAREDLGLRRSGRVGVGRVRRRLPCRRNRGAGDDEEGAALHPQRRIPHRRGGTRRSVRPAFQLRTLSQSARPRRDLHGRIREGTHGAAAPGRAAAEVLPALLRLVPDAEVPLLPLRVVGQHLARRSGAGRGRREHQLCVQQVRDVWRRDHVAPERSQHGGPVPVLAGRGRSPHRRRVLPWLLHHRLLAQRRVRDEVQVHGDDREQPEHAGRQRGADG